MAICGSEDRPLKIANLELPCYVLEDDTRVLSQAGFLGALGRHPKANVRRESGEEQVPPILQGKAINPFISKEILEKSRPIRFRTPNGVVASGYRADLLPDVCEAPVLHQSYGWLVYYREGGMAVRWLRQSGRWEDVVGHSAGTPTYWRPLPEAPVLPAQDQD